MSAKTIACRHLHQPDGWLSPGFVQVDERGLITAVGARLEDLPGSDSTSGSTGRDVLKLDGWVVPGLANVHSHAFQRALSGRTERAALDRDDSFWTWRTEMYRLALAVTPEDIQAIAAQLYVEMLQAGMTAVGEFHYLHHDVDGARYGDRAELSRRIAAAAQTAGIGLTHLPVLYLHGGFGRAPSAEQRRFVHADIDDFLATWDALATGPEARANAHSDALGIYRLGLAPHSLRAVDGESLGRAVAAVRERDARAPIHLHIAEQTAEVEQSLAHLGARPVAWLCDTMQVDERYCLIHATHIDDGEVAALARSGAVVGLCPTTEANLGDGVFPAVAFVERGGRIAIGSDSHATLSAIDELRTLEYGQRLWHRRRNLLRSERTPNVGRFLFDTAAHHGAQALDQPIGALVPGRRADLVALDPDHPRLVGHGPETILDAWIFGAAEGAVADVLVAGEVRVRDGVHVQRAHIAQDFMRAMQRLCSRA